MALETNERVTVGAVFSGGKVRPAWFLWRGRKYAVGEVTFAWESREGVARLQHFSVVSGGNVYALSYNPVECVWDLKGVEQDWRG
ncbi:MAG: hypothetical protein HZC51_08990 [Nitrospirae bacterium]|nr:hypothetical protein [Nitrospirota bacterium]